MKIPPLIRQSGLAWCIAASLAVVALVSGATLTNAAQKDNQTEEKQKDGKQPDSGKEKQGNLTVEVFVLDLEIDPKLRPAARALVRIVGEGREPEGTSEKGRARILGVPRGEVTLEISVLDLKSCRVVVSVRGGDQTVRVVADKSQERKCTLE